ncbi:YgcG family protein [Bradyrhizobium sp. AUGA SZCCT0160]|uniref:TPM domain-containing protein n=1 Tax=Bradyrhizobium sp. AUGA SZCCT0160 TaxID=2807662 RepID=UPI001BA7FC9E|nr:YgcG family protein [Bradyrhizobium sp. AUGA SZCCT0160]MBR1191137.1 YgcG family protein [Bradyrhizobium sp. AUGA SZCCT0160]
MNAARVSILALLLFWAASALAIVVVPPLVGRVVDQTGTLTSGDIASLNQTIRSFETRKGSQVAVLIVPTTDGEAIEQFSLRVAEAWKIGRKKIDDGAVLVIAKNDRHLRIEVGYGLEGALTDVTTKRIIDEEITPKFKSGDFAGGVSAGLNKMIRIIDGEKLPEPEPPHWQHQAGVFDVDALFNPFLLIPVFLFGGLMRTMLGRLVGAGVGGGVVMLIAWFLFGSLVAGIFAGLIAALFVLFSDAIVSSGPGSSGSGGWSGGSSGGSWSGGSSSSSSSSDSGGGGGSFGGGGASGSW